MADNFKIPIQARVKTRNGSTGKVASRVVQKSTEEKWYYLMLEPSCLFWVWCREDDLTPISVENRHEMLRTAEHLGKYALEECIKDFLCPHFVELEDDGNVYVEWEDGGTRRLTEEELRKLKDFIQGVIENTKGGKDDEKEL